MSTKELIQKILKDLNVEKSDDEIDSMLKSLSDSKTEIVSSGCFYKVKFSIDSFKLVSVEDDIEIEIPDLDITLSIESEYLNGVAVFASYEDDGMEIHPHINYDGGICLGSFKDTLIDILSKGNLDCLKSVVQVALLEYNPESEYYPIKYYHPDYDKCDCCEDIFLVDEIEKNDDGYPCCESCL